MYSIESLNIIQGKLEIIVVLITSILEILVYTLAYGMPFVLRAILLIDFVAPYDVDSRNKSQSMTLDVSSKTSQT